MGTRVQILNDSVRWSLSSRSLMTTRPSQAYADQHTAPNNLVGMDDAPAPSPHPVGFCSTTTHQTTGEVSPTKACSSCGCSTPGEQVEPLIVFDWDDTMLASSWIQLRALLQADRNEDLPAEAQRELAILEQSAIKCLATARGLGTVIIITNAESGWVQLSAGKFFVNLLPLLEGIPVVSARSLFEGQFPGSPLCWKSAAFAYMMHDHFLDRSRWTQKTVVSIGDSNEEKMAMRIASGQHSAMAAKSVKFIAGPDPEALACQLDFVTHHLESIVSTDNDVEIILEPSMISNASSLYPDHAFELFEKQQPRCADSPDYLSPIRPPVDEPRKGSASTTASRSPGTSFLNRRTHSAASTASKPIPIPSGGRGGAEGGGDFVQPFSASQASLGGASSCHGHVASRSASGFRGAAMVGVVAKSDGMCVGGNNCGGGASGGAPIDGGGVCGPPCDEGDCGGRMCTPDGDGRHIIPDGVKIAAETGSRGTASTIPRAAISEPDDSEINGNDIGDAEPKAVSEGMGSEEGMFDFDDDVVVRPAPMA